MNDKKTIEYGLLVFAITTILWCLVFAYIIGIINSEHKAEIEKIKTEYNIIKRNEI